MADITFPCPLCNQNIQCDEAWSGQQIQCPICQGALVVPAAQAPAPQSSSGRHNPLVPQPPASSNPRLGFQQNAQKPAVAGRNIPIRNLAPTAAKKKSVLVTILSWTAVLAVLGVGGFFAWVYVVEPMQKKSKEKADAEARNSDGGELGHIGTLNAVLDATDPANPRLDKLAKLNRKPGSSAPSPGIGVPVPTMPPAVTGGSPVNPAMSPGSPQGVQAIPPVWNLDVDQAKVPESPVNGTIAGANFLSDNARLDQASGAYRLSLLQGTGPALERALSIFLRINPGESLTGRVWTVSQDQKGVGVPQIIKIFKANPAAPPQQKAYSGGYAMKLELGAAEAGMLPGKIYVALPDTEQSVAAGVFRATIALNNPSAPPAAPTAPPPGGTAGYDRYGTPPPSKFGPPPPRRQ
ncbi:MAG: hypothetical protein C5B50_25475 [Verrucomicrobia bacterium]|nr:MAG: hypothetical protein C5B50_25475 [Verrucomicrobiota bacterium]